MTERERQVNPRRVMEGPGGQPFLGSLVSLSQSLFSLFILIILSLPFSYSVLSCHSALMMIVIQQSKYWQKRLFFAITNSTDSPIMRLPSYLIILAVLEMSLNDSKNCIFAINRKCKLPYPMPLNYQDHFSCEHN